MDRIRITETLLRHCSAQVRKGNGWWARRVRSLSAIVGPRLRTAVHEDEDEWEWEEWGLIDDPRLASAAELLEARTPLLRFDWWPPAFEEPSISLFLDRLDLGTGTAFLTGRGGDCLEDWVLLSAIHPSDSVRAWSAAARDVIGAGCSRYWDCPPIEAPPASTFNHRPGLVPRSEVQRGFMRVFERQKQWDLVRDRIAPERSPMHPELVPAGTPGADDDDSGAGLQWSLSLAPGEKRRLLGEYLRWTYREP